MNVDDKLPLLVSEIYGPVIQGEGIVAGTPTLFVRMGGCDYKCSWCDSLYAVLPEHKKTWKRMNADGIITKCLGLAEPPYLVTLSGGNPALHHQLGDVIELGHKVGYRFAIETQGTKFPYWATILDSITLSPKPPSSGMITDWLLLRFWLDRTDHVPERSIKVVIFDMHDFNYARKVREIAREYNVPLFLQTGTDEPYMDTSAPDRMAAFRNNILAKLDWLGDLVIQEKWSDVRVLPQIHALIHGAKRGV